MPAGPLGDGGETPVGPQLSDGLSPAGGYRCFSVSQPLEGVVEVVLNRDSAVNAMSSTFIRDMHQICDALQYPRALGSTAPRILVIRGEGRAFCSGYDMRDPSLSSSDQP